MVRCSIVIGLAAAMIFGACGKDEDPVSVPMGDVPLPPPPSERPSTSPDLTSTATATSSAQSPGNYGGPRSTGTKKASEAPIDSCCSALLDKANKSKDQETKKLYDQAASICYRRARQVRDGKMSRGEALAQVRSSLLGPAPAACH